MTADPPGLANQPEDDRVDEAIAEYLIARDRGRPIPDGEWLAQHPDLRAALVGFLAGRSLVRQLAAPPVGRSTPQGLERIRYFGDFELIKVLGQGGMGVVYLAHQISLGRPVALKMIRSGHLAGDDEIRRFRNEAEAVARLDHPNLLTIFEVGEHEGRRYFTMPLIGGGSLADRLDRYRDDPRSAARILHGVAAGIDHAHRRGILHRDLKPGNVLIGDDDRPLVGDFGLSKDLESGESSTSSIVGTPAYMAPEQASGRPGTATTACDIYGLGAILYAMLTGRPPIAGPGVEALRGSAARPPERPSRLNRRVDLRLEAICLKCLETDPRRRYSSAAAVGEDLDRWQRGRPIEARPMGRVARFGLWCRRRPLVAGLSGALAASTLTGASLLWRSYEVVRQQRDEVRSILGFLTDDLLGRASYTTSPRRDDTLSSVLGRGVQAVHTRFAANASLQASTLVLLADTYRTIGMHDEAERALAAAKRYRAVQKGGDGLDRLEDDHSEAALRLAQGRVKDALRIAASVERERRRRLGGSDEATLETSLLLASACRADGQIGRAEAISDEAYATSRKTYGERHRLTLGAMSNVAVLANDRGRFAESESLLRHLSEIRRADLGPDHPDTLFAMNNLGAVLLARGQGPAAEEILAPLVDRARRGLGDDHPYTRLVVANLEAARASAGRPAQDSAGLPPLGRLARRLAINKAMILLKMQRRGEAEVALRQLLADARRELPPGDEDLEHILVDLAGVLLESGKYPEATVLAAEAIRLHETKGPADGGRMTNLLALEARILVAGGRFDEAEPLCRRVLALRLASPSSAPPWKTATARSLLGAALMGRGQYDPAEPYLVDGFAALRDDREASQERRDEARDRLVALYRKQGRVDAARALDPKSSPPSP